MWCMLDLVFGLGEDIFVFVFIFGGVLVLLIVLVGDIIFEEK